MNNDSCTEKIDNLPIPIDEFQCAIVYMYSMCVYMHMYVYAYMDVLYMFKQVFLLILKLFLKHEEKNTCQTLVNF